MSFSNGQHTRNPDEHLIPVEVPAIVSREMWEAAQKRLKQNKETSRRNLKNEYLLRSRVTCAGCGFKMSGCTKSSGGKRC
ncbi:MAG: recombinase family protein [Anaerolineae bacterium]